MANNLYLDPNGFRAQIDAYKTAGSALSGVKYDVPESSMQLQSIAKLQECINEFNAALASMAALASKDVFNLNQIIAIWGNMDAQNAQITQWDKITGKDK